MIKRAIGIIIAIAIAQIPIFICINSDLLKGIFLGFFFGLIICLTLVSILLKNETLK
jgi:hypothetical protein